MSENQESVGTWIDATFPGTDPKSPRKAIRALEEMLELCLASGATPNELFKAVQDAVSVKPWSDVGDDERRQVPNQIPIEAADVLIVLYGVAHMRGFDLHAEVNKKMAINRARKWRTLGDGTGYHVK